MILDAKFRGLKSQSQEEKVFLRSRSSSVTGRVVTVSAAVKRGRSNVTSKPVKAAPAKEKKNPSHVKVLNPNANNARAIGIIVPDIANNFFSGVIAGVEEMAGNENFTTIICQSGEQWEKERAAVQTLIEQNVACIIISLSAETASTHNIDHLKKAIDHNIKVIQFDRVDNALATDCVVNEVDSVTDNIIGHLIAQGYKNIACLAGPQTIDIFKKRKEAFEKYMKKMGMRSIKNNIAFYDLTRESAKAAAEKLLTLKNRPDAIVAATDLGALGVWDVTKEMGLEMPKDLGLCGFSNEYYTELVSPNITSTDQQSLEMGKGAALIFFDYLRMKDGQQQAPRTIILDPKLIVRASSNRTEKFLL